MTDSIAHYRIGARLGQGGMGEVYRATDTKLGRDVALKVIAPTLAQDPMRLAGVAREAQVLASLNHPNIAAVYGIEDHAIIMELVEGPTLADRLKQGPIPLEEALGIARQIAAGLEAAHEKGIVHRDLKPGNVKITADGTIKLLDFGLAKHAALAVADEAATMAATSSGVGLIEGTPGYMAPEQVRGKAIDKRADVWAFGVVLYEMLTGGKLFEGDNPTDVMASVVTREPDLSRVPASVRPMLRRCLEKDPKKRVRDVADAMLLLDSTNEAPGVDTATPASSRRFWIAAGSAAVLAVVLAIVAFIHFRETTPTPEVVRFSTTLPQNVNFTQNGGFAVSPDGRSVAFPAIGPDGVKLWIQRFDSLVPQPLSVDVPQGLDTQFWSPDSRFVAFTTFPPMRQLKRVDVSGGPAQTIADLPSQVMTGTWDRGMILMGAFEGILQIPVDGGKPTFVTKTDPSRKEIAHYAATLLPDGRQFLYIRGGAPGTRGVFIGSLDVKPEEQSTTPLLMTDYNVAFVQDRRGRSGAGWLLFVRDGTLLAQSFDPASRKLTGDPTPVAEGVAVINGNAAGGAYFSVSEAGTLTYRTGAGVIDGRQLAWLDRQGKLAGAASEVTRYAMLKVSPDGTRAATMRLDPQTISNADIWITDLTRDTSIRLTVDRDRVDSQPVWSPDGKRVAWQGGRPGSSEFLIRAADGSGAEQTVFKFDPPGPLLTDWTSDGRFLVFSRAGDIFALPIGEGTESNRQPIPVVQTPANEFGAYVSPDSRWVAYISNESGKQEIYVQPFAPGWKAAGAAPSGGKTLISRGTLGLARWRGDGKELVYVSADGKLMAVDVTLSPSFTAGQPRALFDLPREFLALTRTPGSIADLSRDHQRIFLLMPPPASRQGINVVLNWPASLSR